MSHRNSLPLEPGWGVLLVALIPVSLWERLREWKCARNRASPRGRELSNEIGRALHEAQMDGDNLTAPNSGRTMAPHRDSPMTKRQSAAPRATGVQGAVAICPVASASNGFSRLDPSTYTVVFSIVSKS